MVAMSARFRLVMILIVAMAAVPASALPASCPRGVEVSGSAVESVGDIFRIRALHRGKQVNFNGVALAFADFSGRDVSNMCFHKARLERSDWSRATGDNLQFHGAELSRSRWHRFRGEGLDFHFSNLDHAQLTRSVMRTTTFYSTSMAGMDASHADLSGGSLKANVLASLRQARFDFANMTGFEFHCGIGQEDNCGHSNDVSLAGANLTDAAILTGSKSGWDLRNAVLDNTRTHFFQLDWIRESRIEGPVVVVPTAWTPARDRFSERVTPVSLSQAELGAVWRAFDQLDEPDFDCSQSVTAAEHYICSRKDRYGDKPFHGPSRFAKADRELNQAYVLAWRKDRSIVADQRQWLRERDACMAREADAYGWLRDDCIAAAYRERIEELWQLAGMETAIGAGERRIFVDHQTGEFLWEIGDSELRSKLVSMALGNSWQLVVVERDRQRRLNASGSAIGPNYHFGDLGSPEAGMAFDAASGFYGGSKPCLPGYDLCPIIRIRGYYLDAGPQGMQDEATGEYHSNGYIATGARAGFGRLVALPDW
jgi:uncharacterized protein YjbI with pentapeptide repeats